MKELKSIKWNSGILSIVCFLLGLILLIWPIEALSFGTKIIGIVVLLAGFGNIIRFILIQGEKPKNEITFFILSIVAVAIGASILINPTLVIVTINIIIGSILIVTGVINMSNVLIIRGKDTKWWAFGLISLVICILGFVIIINPITTADVITRLQGAALIFDTVSSWVILYRINRFFN